MMPLHHVGLLVLLICANFCKFVTPKYLPNWKSLDTRPLPAWYDESKFGIFLHWGLFSVPSFGSEWFWQDWRGYKSKDFVAFMDSNYKPNFTYADFAPQFTAELFNPDAWADMFRGAGAKYVVLTSKHHEGFTMWPSSVSWNWNALDVGPKKDLVGLLANSIRNRTDLHFGLYHSLFEWFHPLYLQDKNNKFKTNKFVMNKAMPELKEIVEAYKPEVIWSDGDWEAPPEYWNSTEFIAWLYNDSPVKNTVVTNDRWGIGVTCHHGDFLTCQDKYNPGKLQKKKWENAMTIDRGAWGYRRNVQLSDYLTPHDLIATLVETVSCGGNLLVNVGPTADGRILPIFEERLRQMGSWLQVNGQAVYSSKPWTHQNDTLTPGVWYTKDRDGNFYAFLLKWPRNAQVELGAVQFSSVQPVASMLGLQRDLRLYPGKFGTVVDLSKILAGQLPCQWAWVIKFTSAGTVDLGL